MGKLAEHNLKIGDLIRDTAASSGGEIYKIVSEADPVPVRDEEEYVKKRIARHYVKNVRVYRALYTGRRVDKREKGLRMPAARV